MAVVEVLRRQLMHCHHQDREVPTLHAVPVLTMARQLPSTPRLLNSSSKYSSLNPPPPPFIALSIQVNGIMHYKS